MTWIRRALRALDLLPRAAKLRVGADLADLARARAARVASDPALTLVFNTFTELWQICRNVAMRACIATLRGPGGPETRAPQMQNYSPIRTRACLRLLLGEIIATQRRATPTQRHAKHGSTLKETLAFLSGTMDFHKPNAPTGLNRYNSSRTSLKISLKMTKENFISIA